jgi:hypothetical protein
MKKEKMKRILKIIYPFRRKKIFSQNLKVTIKKPELVM